MRTYFQVRGEWLDEVKGEVVRQQPLTIFTDGERFVHALRCVGSELSMSPRLRPREPGP